MFGFERPRYGNSSSPSLPSNLPLRQQFPDNPSFDCLVIPKQSPGGVADGQKAHRTLLLKAPIGLRAPQPGTCRMKCQGSFTCSSDTAQALALVTQKKLPK